MTIFEDNCVGCPQGCIHCGRDKVAVIVCDQCQSDDTIYDFYGKELCAECLLKEFSRKTGTCDMCGEETTVYDTDDGILCKECFLEDIPEVKG